ncbi:hypothetical protein [Metabacillus arenae]|uniref:C1q domain-containing protein n=1 Tax=Metabacillus arenae TaxID=2771434 RepID=A0A926RXV0_9BACI|nr:hypothetical protein [Metabacillus arenae]MBD1381346.1 hypothetical protein [Metabacillus arenae]
MGIILTPAYGYAVRTNTTNMAFIINSPVLFDTAGPLNDVDFEATGLRVQRSGVYHVQYTTSSFQSDSAGGSAAFVYLRVRVNGTPVAIQYQSRLELEPQSPGNNVIQHVIPQHGSLIVELDAGDLVEVVPDATNNSAYQTTYLQVIQIL